MLYIKQCVLRGGGINVNNIILSSTGTYSNVSGSINTAGKVEVNSSNSIQFDISNYSKVTITRSTKKFDCVLSDGNSTTTISVPTTGQVIDITDYILLTLKYSELSNSTGSITTGTDRIDRVTGSTDTSIIINSIKFE